MVRVLIAASLLVYVAGCGGSSGPVVADVSGVVTLDGQPLEGAEIKLISDKSMGFGKTRAGGKYQLVQGVLPGKYKVVISKLDGKPVEKQFSSGETALNDPGQLEAIAAAQETDPKNAGKPRPKAPKELIAADFSDPNQTKLALDVPAAGTTSGDFKLTSQ